MKKQSLILLLGIMLIACIVDAKQIQLEHKLPSNVSYLVSRVATDCRDGQDTKTFKVYV